MPVGPAVMLASSPRDSVDAELARLLRDGGWYFELKFDGIRAVVSRNARGEVVITNRRQVDITYRYPDVVFDIAQRPFTGVIDGEIIVAGPDGRPSFALAHRRDAQNRPAAANRLANSTPATFMPFDVLAYRGDSVRTRPWTARRELLLDTYGAGVPTATRDGLTMWKFVTDHDLEGLVAKRADSLYLPRRSSAWVKLKRTRRVSALVTGVVPGKGSRGAVGALRLALRDAASGKLVAIGSVGSGLSERAQAQALTLLEGARPVVADVEFLEVAPSGQLRMPVFKGFRDDVDPAGLTTDVLPRS